MTSETLAPDIAWDEGHLSEVALSVLSDGEEALLDAEMHAHLDACEECEVRLGEIALRSADVGEALSLAACVPASVGARAPASAGVRVPVSAGARAPASAGAREATPIVRLPAPIVPVAAPLSRGGSGPRSGRRKVPVALIGAALAVAILGAAPALVTLPADVATTASVLRKVLPSLVRMLPAALGRLWNGPTTGASVALLWALSLVLVAAGLGIAKKASKRTIVDGGRR